GGWAISQTGDELSRPRARAIAGPKARKPHDRTRTPPAVPLSLGPFLNLRNMFTPRKDTTPATATCSSNEDCGKTALIACLTTRKLRGGTRMRPHAAMFITNASFHCVFFEVWVSYCQPLRMV